MANSWILLLIVIGIITAIIIAGFAAGYSTVFCFNRMPVDWLVDYGEEPDESLYGVRLAARPYGMALSIIFVLVFTFLVMQYDSLFYILLGMVVLWLLMLIGIADHKYMIIPDQLVAALAVAAAILAVVELFTGGLAGLPPYFHKVWYSPIAGALIGGGSIYLIGVIGALLTRQEAMGFGDVKLLAAAGLLCGIRGILTVLVLTVLTSGIWFIILLAAKKIRRGDHKPLGPYIAASCGIYFVFYSQVGSLVDLYLDLYRI